MLGRVITNFQQWLWTQIAFRVIEGLSLPVAVSKLDAEDLQLYDEAIKNASRNAALWNEVDALRQSAVYKIARTAKADETLSFHRGGLLYLEALKRRIDSRNREARKRRSPTSERKSG